MEEDRPKVCGKFKEIEARYWNLKRLMGAEIKSIFVNVSLESGDEDFKICSNKTVNGGNEDSSRDMQIEMTS
jgi:hypothetical protein